MAAPHATAPVGNVNVNLAETRLLMPVILADPRAVSQRPVFLILALPTGCAPFLTLVAWAESPYIPVPFLKPRPRTDAPAPFAKSPAPIN
ncbi:hypothetical protein PCANC_03714 [Puccinia coronata f. sp. avenae]|uniref:Uncharacterized protein n=1 Tax=Puccinia coronata f. sp. avenae TaxID=200324 RepID=A0A2N5VXT2_9BASI|nr:hypothetical protein PCANC_03714 [Puccinia coronata f. sp. avenae]